ncbi:TonB-dependent receptor [Vibrio sp. D404a]|uniref:TonB-dependent receptor domain-containing protein n=2 Tax=Vibrio TaxID=662 RepID=UPI00255288AA|nr:MULTISPECIES: TonB-dependent receptor [unclassified Vibrio]MDK9735747.1 TonB-dependent receptor [Vibrio sp. D404a]MDK9798663.1 TonB-dependent receptor [Vibrio sp. D449a]
MLATTNRTLVSLAVAAAMLPLAVQAEAENEHEVMTVTGTGFEQEMALAPASITVIDASEIENKGYRNITEALQSVPGVYAEEGSNGGKGATSDVSIRGFGSDYTLILVNGKPQGSSQAYYNGYGGGAEFDWLPPISVIERIEVVRGPMSSLYGSDALGGVINVITKRGQDTWTGEVSVETVISEDSDEGNSEKLSYYVSGPAGSEDLMLTLSGNAYMHDESEFSYGSKDTTNINNSIKLEWYLSMMQTLTFEAGFASQVEDGKKDKSGQNPTNPNKSVDTELDVSRQFYGIGHDISWGDNETVSYWQMEYVDTLAGTAGNADESDYTRHTLNSQTTTLLDFGHVVWGGQFNHQNINHDPDRALEDSVTELTRNDYALFGELHWDINSDLVLTSGARYVYDEKYGSEVVPRVYAVYELDQDWVLKGGVSKGYRTPNIKESDSSWIEGGGGSGVNGANKGNEDLKSEKSWNYEASINWRDHSHWNASLTTYYTEFSDAIVLNAICDVNVDGACEGGYDIVYQWENEDSAELMGVETSVKYMADLYDITLSHTYSDSEITKGVNKGDKLNYIPSHMVNLSGSYSMSEKISLWGKVQYRSADEAIQGKNTVIDAPSYTITDIGANYDLNDTFNAYAGISNLFDEDVNYEEYGKILDGRRYTLGLRAQF